MPTLDFFAILPQSILVIMALLLLLVDVTVARHNKAALGWVALLGIIAALGATAWLWTMPGRTFQDMAIADNFALSANLVILIAAGLGVLLSMHYVPRISQSQGEYFALLLLATAGMTMMAASTSLMTVFLSLETLSLALYIMTGFNLKEPRSSEAAMKYFLLGAFASGFFLFGSAMLYGATRSTVFAEMAAAIAQLSASDPLAILLPVGIGLLLVGFGFKVAMVPFHMWTPDVYQGAPTPVTAFMSVGTKTAVLAALLRVLAAMTGAEQPWLWVLAILSVLTMTLGNLAALRQSSIKRMLAYSSIAHAGYLLIALTANSDQAVGAALYYLLAYVFMNIGAFAVLVVLEHASDMDVLATEANGLGRRYPLLGAAMTVFMLSLAGIPPLAGFFGKLYVFGAAVQTGWTWLVVVAVINSAISAYYYLRVVVNMYMEPETSTSPVTTKPAWTVAIVLAVAGTVLVGLWPTPWIELTRSTLVALIGG
jgi:NADH-quinone oxidoreductase subunit N